MRERLKLADVTTAGIDDWRMIQNALYATFRTGTFAAGFEFLGRITELAEQANHHPDVTLTYPALAVRLLSHDADGVTRRDLDLARAISELAAAAGIEVETEHTIVDLGLDTPDAAPLAPFWAAVLGGSDAGEEVVTGAGTPDVWFQKAEATAPVPAQRWHPDVWVPHDRAEERVKAALDAGGRLVSDSAAPAYWVLADPQGNRVCICTNLDR